MALTVALFLDPHQTASDIDILDIQSDQRRGSQTQCTQQHNNNEISQSHGRIGLFGEVADQNPVLTGCQKLRDGFFDFRIG